MDGALIKPQKVRRVVRLRPSVADGAVPGAGAALSAANDITAHGSLVEVADPRALRPADFRADFVYAPPSASVEDVAQNDLPPLLEAVLSGTDAVLLLLGSEGAGQADFLEGASGDGRAGLCAAAAARLIAELQERQARHRQGGSGGFAYQAKIRYCQVVGDRVEDLFTDRPEPSRVIDTEDGVVIEGLRALGIVGLGEAEQAIEAAMKRRAISPHKGKDASVFILEVTQADYWAGWGLYGKLMIVEAPPLNCLAEDRGLVQLREGFDTYRGLYHLRTLVHNWQPRQAGDVAATALTLLLREALCGGSVSLTALLCLQQGQPAVSRVALEFLDEFEKVETNPVNFDHRVAGFARAARAERVNLARGVGAHGDRDADEDARRIIRELEKRLHAAERTKDDVARYEEFRDARSRDLQDKLATALHGQESIHERLVASEQQHLEACQGVVELQLHNLEVKDEMSEMQYKDNMMLVLLEQEVADLQMALKERRTFGDEAERGLSTARGEYQSAEGIVQELRAAADERAQASAEEEEAAHKHAADSAGQHEEVVAAMEKRLEVGLKGPREEAERLKTLSEKLEAKQKFQRDLARLTGAGGAKDTSEVPGSAGSQGDSGDVVAKTARRLMDEKRQLQTKLRRLQEEVLTTVRSAGVDEGGAASGVASAVAAEADHVEDTLAAHDQEKSALLAALEKERHEAALAKAAHALEMRKRDAERSLLEAQSLGGPPPLYAPPANGVPSIPGLGAPGGAASSRPPDVEIGDLQRKLLSEAPLGGGVAGGGGGMEQAALLAKNRELQARIDQLEKNVPAGHRSHLQRLAFLEKQLPHLEAERSEFLVRATVAEEQLVQIQRHLKELTESYQMQILNLKLAAGKALGK
eukprot:TRINITY_DN44610_c0_g2_i4.p1 TRINITY_DN44610_c0_g2~~TRINITY_DN44610_c0_g2_i4.p1  ORF type:complete len:874 (-),score=270.07 TRINITY_DN44610_c0_g2_i4:21-2642(-)